MPLFVKFWGTRGSIPTPGHRTQRFGGNTPCLEIRTEDLLIACDGGTGLREMGLDLQRRFGPKALTVHLFFSHPHWDHIQGFPFFTPAYMPNTILKVYGPAKGDHTIHDLLSGQMQSTYFPVTFSALGAKVETTDLDPSGQKELDRLRVTAFAQAHPGGSLGYAFEYDGSKVVYSTDNEIDRVLEDPKAVEKNPKALRKIPDDLVEFCKGADLLIADGQYTDAEYLRRVGWGHPRATTVVDLAVRAHVKQLAITHHDPMHSDADVDSIVATCSRRAQEHGSQVVVFGAREGIELKIGT